MCDIALISCTNNNIKMVLEEKLREASCLGDLEAVQMILNQNVDINSKNQVNGWTALHWACKRNHEPVIKHLLHHGADPTAVNNDGRRPAEYLSNNATTIMSYLFTGGVPTDSHSNNDVDQSDSTAEQQHKFMPNYVRNPPLNGGQVDVGQRYRARHTDISALPTTNLPASNDADLVLRVRIHGSHDPDFIEVELPRWRLTYAGLMHICCEELDVKEAQVDRIRKLPNTRLRKDSDVRRLGDLCSLEVVLKSPLTDKHNSYQSISTCKDQTILY